jgi:hypothetical protein
MFGKPPPGTPPTNKRPWPGDRVRIKTSSVLGTVSDYEYWLNGHTFPVRVDHPAGVTRMFIQSEVAVVATDHRDVVVQLPQKPAEPADTVTSTVGQRGEGVA